MGFFDSINEMISNVTGEAVNSAVEQGTAGLENLGSSLGDLSGLADQAQAVIPGEVDDNFIDSAQAANLGGLFGGDQNQ